MKHPELRIQNSPPLRHWTARTLAAAALPALMLGAALPATADSVSNLSLGGSQGPTVTSTFPSAQGFTTGSNSGGYTLTSVTLKLADARATADIITVSLYSATSDGKPNASLATLNPTTEDISSAANYTFTCGTGCQLDGDNASYFIVLEVGAARQYYWYQDSSPTQTNTPADAGWEIADVAQYNNRGTWTNENPAVVKLMQVSYVGPDLWVENISQTEADLKLRNWGGGTWSYKIDFSGAGRESCRPITRGTYVSLSLAKAAGSEYTVSAHRGSTCGEADLLDTETFTTLADGVKRPLLSVSGVGSASATLNLADHTGDWWYQRYRTGGAGVCTKVNSGTYSASLSNLTANKAYTYAAYSHAGCKEASVPITWISTVSFNTTGPISATVTDYTDSQVTLTVAGINEGKWSFTYRNENTGKFSACRTFGASTKSVIARGLESGTPFTFRVYRGSSCNWDDRVTVNAHTISLSSGQVGSNSATLKMEHYDGDWHHKQAGGGQGASATGIRPKSSNGCSTAVSGTTASLSGLTPSTDYTWKAYKAEGCADADEIASTTFTTLAEGQSPPDAGGGNTGGGGSVGGGGGGSGGGGSGSSTPRTPQDRPAVTALALASDPGPDFRYAAGDEIVVEATFSEPVRAFTESLTLDILVGGEARTAEYVGGSETKTLRFRYVVGPEDRDLDGIGFPADALKANFGRIHSLGGLASPLDIGEDALPATTGHRVGPPPSVPLLPAANDAAGRQGFVRVINHGAEAGEVSITAHDDSGTAFGPVTLSIGANASAHFNATDLEAGNAAKGLSGGTGLGQGDWRLEFGGAPAIEAIGYVRHSDGFLTAVQDVAPRNGGVHSLATFNPASNHRQLSRLRIVNLGSELASVKVTGVDDAGVSPGGAVSLSLAAGAAEVCDAPELESGSGIDGGLGDGEGKWRLSAEADGPVEAMGLMESPSGHLTNLSTAPSVRHGDALVVPLFLSASDPHGRQGFVRIINRSDEAGRVYIKARDDSGRDHSQMELRIGANAVVHLNSDDLEVGASAKGLKGSTGPASAGDWRLELTSGLDIEALAYVRHKDGFLTSMHDVAPSANGVHRVATFNPASNDRQRSLLRIVNLGNERAKVTVTGIDGGGASPGTDVEVEVRAGRSLTLIASQLEEGGIGIKGALGDGASKWRLRVTSQQDILVMSLLESPSGHLTNLSSRPLRAD